MKGRITRNYCYLNDKVVDMWYIQGIPFTFEELPQAMAELDEVEEEAADATGEIIQTIPLSVVTLRVCPFSTRLNEKGRLSCNSACVKLMIFMCMLSCPLGLSV